jgi:hypothetical protein
VDSPCLAEETLKNRVSKTASRRPTTGCRQVARDSWHRCDRLTPEVCDPHKPARPRSGETACAESRPWLSDRVEVAAVVGSPQAL